MKIKLIGEPRIIMQNPGSKHNYFGWPTAARLQNGKIAVVASGFRLRHICPFGKAVLSLSADDGETYTSPEIVIDTVLDDRDGGILPFGESGVMITSFNNTVAFQRGKAENGYDSGYLDTITPEEEARDIGANFRISNDLGVTFGEIHKSPVTSPHGPIQLSDGKILWVGRTFSPDNSHRIGVDRIEAHTVNLDGSMEYVGTIETPEVEGFVTLACEPHAIEVDGRIVAHMRVHDKSRQRELFTIYQSESYDKGRTWSKPHALLSRTGGAPPHLFRHSSGMLISAYGYRTEPFGIKVMFSEDGGESWDIDNYLYKNDVDLDLGYPSTVELSDGSLLTVFYARPDKDGPAVIMQQKCRFEK